MKKIITLFITICIAVFDMVACAPKDNEADTTTTQVETITIVATEAETAE